MPLARFVHVERDGRVVADLFELEVPVRACAPGRAAPSCAAARIAGRRRSGARWWPPAGAPARHAHVYTHDLETRPALDAAGLRAHAGRPARPRSCCRSTSPRSPPGHPDRLEAAAGAPPSRADAWPGSCCPAAGSPSTDGEVVAALLIATIAEAPPPFGGPWILEVFRARARGAGRALLQRALARTEGRLGLAVTEGNPAERALRVARLPPHLHGVFSRSLARARRSPAPSTPAGSVP